MKKAFILSMLLLSGSLKTMQLSMTFLNSSQSNSQMDKTPEEIIWQFIHNPENLEEYTRIDIVSNKKTLTGKAAQEKLLALLSEIPYLNWQRTIVQFAIITEHWRLSTVIKLDKENLESIIKKNK